MNAKAAITSLKEKGILQSDIARILEVDPGTVSRFCRDEACTKAIVRKFLFELDEAYEQGMDLLEVAEGLDCYEATKINLRNKTGIGKKGVKVTDLENVLSIIRAVYGNEFRYIKKSQFKATSLVTRASKKSGNKLQYIPLLRLKPYLATRNIGLKVLGEAIVLFHYDLKVGCWAEGYQVQFSDIQQAFATASIEIDWTKPVSMD